MSTKTVNDQSLSTEELEALLAQRKKEDAAKRSKEKRDYEIKRNDTVKELQSAAKLMHKLLKEFKMGCHKKMEEMATTLKTYGIENKKSKGGFSLMNEEADFKIIRRRDTNPVWDERSNKGIALIKEFLDDTVKKAAQKEYKIIMGFLERNKQGDLEYSKVMHLLQHKDNYQDERWQLGCQLVLEGYNIQFKAYNYEFKTKNKAGEWKTLSLNISSISDDDVEEKS